jgi:hypothetical protein
MQYQYLGQSSVSFQMKNHNQPVPTYAICIIRYSQQENTHEMMNQKFNWLYPRIVKFWAILGSLFSLYWGIRAINDQDA